MFAGAPSRPRSLSRGCRPERALGSAITRPRRTPGRQPLEWRSVVGEGGKAGREEAPAGGGAWSDRKLKAPNAQEAQSAV